MSVHGFSIGIIQLLGVLEDKYWKMREKYKQNKKGRIEGNLIKREKMGSKFKAKSICSIEFNRWKERIKKTDAESGRKKNLKELII